MIRSLSGPFPDGRTSLIVQFALMSYSLLIRLKLLKRAQSVRSFSANSRFVWLYQVILKPAALKPAFLNLVKLKLPVRVPVNTCCP